jgi:cytochrome c-type biogenesis protein CcmH
MTTRSYKRWPAWLAMALVLAALLAVGVKRSGEPQTADERVQAIAERLACPVCQGESVADSRATSAIQIKTNIERLVTEGRLTDREIVSEIQSRYQEDLSLIPSASGFDSLIYVLPSMAAVGGAVGLYVAFSRWRRRPEQAGPSDDDRRLVEAALHPEPGE